MKTDWTAKVSCPHGGNGGCRAAMGTDPPVWHWCKANCEAYAPAPEWKKYRLRGERWECEVADIADGCLPLVCVKGGIHTGTRVRLDGRVLDALFEVVYMGRINLRTPTITACRTTGGIMPGTVIVPAGQSDTNTYDVRKPPSEAEGGELFYRIPAPTFEALFEEVGDDGPIYPDHPFELWSWAEFIAKHPSHAETAEGHLARSLLFLGRNAPHDAPSPPDGVDWDDVQKIYDAHAHYSDGESWNLVVIARALLELRDRLDNLDKWCAKAMEIWSHMPTQEDVDAAVEGYNKLEDRLDGLYQSLRNHNHGNRFKKLEDTLEEMQGKLARAVGDKTCITIDLEPGQAAELVSLIERHIEE